jgi:hypothetical protein
MKGLVRLISVAILSSVLFAAFSAQAQTDVKFQILQIREEIRQNQDNPNFDMNAAMNRLEGLMTSYKAEGEHKANLNENDQKVKPSTVNTVGEGQSSAEIRDKEAYLLKQKDFIEEVRKARDEAISRGVSTAKYDQYIKEYEQVEMELSKLKR